eukprot:snap_masked-scaffold_6-processed-gene-2.26-mRNA-1 protein AED:1.00 eAED:1.00 QI:0/-1/0/0/-1/1/1/0/311
MKKGKPEIKLFIKVEVEDDLEEDDVSLHCLQIKSSRIDSDFKPRKMLERKVLEYSRVFPGENVIAEHAGKLFCDFIGNEDVPTEECFFEFRTGFNKSVDVKKSFFAELMKNVAVCSVILNQNSLRSVFFSSTLSSLFALGKETRVIIEGRFEPLLLENLIPCSRELNSHFYRVEENFRRISFLRSSQEDMFSTRKFLRSKSFLFQNSFSNLRHLELFAARKEKKTNSREQCCFLLGLRDSLRGNKSVKLFLEVWSLYCSDPALISCVYELGSSSCVKKVLFRNYRKEKGEEQSWKLLTFLNGTKKLGQNLK